MIAALTLQGKVIAAVIAVAIIGTTITLTVNKIKHDAYQNGVEACQAKAQEALDKANEANAKATSELQSDLDDYAKRYETLANQRRDREQVIVERIEEKLLTEENCQITPELLILRNRIRAQ